MYLEVVVVRNNKHMLGRDIDTSAAFTAGGIDDFPETVVVLPLVHTEVRLATLVGHAYVLVVVEHQLNALHEVGHDVLLLGNHSLVFFVELVEVDERVCDHLESVRPFHVVDESLDVKLVVLFPLHLVGSFQKFVVNQFQLEEQQLVRRHYHQHFVVIKIRIADVPVRDPLLLDSLWLGQVHEIGLALSEEHIHEVSVVIIEATEWKVSSSLSQVRLNGLSNQLLLLVGVQEVPHCVSGSVVEVDKDVVLLLVLNEADTDHGIWEVVVGPGQVVNAYLVVDLVVVKHIILVEHQQVKHAIIQVWAHKDTAFLVLCDLLGLDIVAFQLFREGFLERI